MSGPHFSTFLGMQCFCYIMLDHLCSYIFNQILLLYVMKGSLNTLETTLKVLLEIPKDCQTSPEVARDVQRAIDPQGPREKEGRRKKNIVCILYIYIYCFPQGRGDRKGKNRKTSFFFRSPLSQPSPPIQPLPNGRPQKANVNNRTMKVY